LFAGSIVHTQSNICMRIIAGGGYQSVMAVSDCVFPSLQIFCRPRKKICKHQMPIAPVRPKPIKQQRDPIRVALMCAWLTDIDFTAEIKSAKLPVLCPPSEE